MKTELYVKHDFAQSTKTYEYEEAFSEMEGRIAPILHLIIEHARRDSLPNLLRADRVLLKQFVLATVHRTPESQRRISRAGNKDAFYEAAKARAEQAGLPLADCKWPE